MSTIHDTTLQVIVDPDSDDDIADLILTRSGLADLDAIESVHASGPYQDPGTRSDPLVLLHILHDPELITADQLRTHTQNTLPDHDVT